MAAYFKYKKFQVLIDFNKDEMNNGIYLELKEQVKSDVYVYSITITEKYMLENIKILTNLADLYEILLLSFNKEKNKLIKLEITDTDIEEGLLLKYNYSLALQHISFNIDFNLILNKAIIKHKIKTICDDTDYKLLIDKITELDYNYSKLYQKYKNMKTYNYLYYFKLYNSINGTIPHRLSNKNKHFYITCTEWENDYIRPLKDKFYKLINNTEYYLVYFDDSQFLQAKRENPSFTDELRVQNILGGGNRDRGIHIIKSFDIKDILYNIKHLIINNIRPYNNLNLLGLHIKKYEINIDINYFSKFYVYKTISGTSILEKYPSPTIFNDSFIKYITDFSLYILYNCTIDWLIINQDMVNLTEVLTNKEKYKNIMKIQKGIILNNCKTTYNRELADYCHINKLELIY